MQVLFMFLRGIQGRGKQHRWSVRAVSVLCALGVVCLYSVARQSHSLAVGSLEEKESSSFSNELLLNQDEMHHSVSSHRHLLSLSDREFFDSGLGNTSKGGDDDDDGSNCTMPREPHDGYNSSCAYVRVVCQGQVQLIDYLSILLCNLNKVEWLGYILLGLWLIYLISLLATTADYFFVPPLTLLSDKLRLSPSIAGITLLAVGNGAPDVFTAYAALKQGEIELVLGALIGASIFISTVVLGTVILITKVTSETIDKIDFVRDIIAYMCAVGMVIGIAYDGTVHLYEALMFPAFYFIYIALAVGIMYLRQGLAARKLRRKNLQEESEREYLIKKEEDTEDNSTLTAEIAATINEGAPAEPSKKTRVVLEGLTWPRGSHIGVKVQWFLEWPFSLLRWLSIPPCCHDGNWTVWHRWFAVTSPVPMAMLLLLAFQGWGGFQDIYLGKLPLFGFLIIVGTVISVILFFVLKTHRPPHWSMQAVLGTAAFIMSIAWLNIEATETVATLQSFGLLFDIDTAILGLTVLAIGNSVGDWVADTAVARAGRPGMAVSSCFGSPLLNDVLGLSVALIARIGFYGRGKAFTFDIHRPDFAKVKLSWIFLGISLLSSAVVFPLFKFSPPKTFGVALLYIYAVFMVFSILNEVGVFPLNFD